MKVEEIPLFTKTRVDFTNLHSIEACAVAVAYCIYDKNKKTIVQKGTSRACGDNSSRKSVHAEEICINYCRNYNKRNKRNKYEIYIWRYSKDGKVKPVYCCVNCCQLAEKFHYYNKIYTFDNNNICPAVGKPYNTIGHIMKYGL